MSEGLVLQNICQGFPTQNGDRIAALGGVTFEVSRGEIVALLGPSGCGKTSLLNIVAGFEQQMAGQALFGGLPLGAPDGKRGVVFQQPALFEWLTVGQNVAFGLKRQHIPPAKRNRLTGEMLALVGLSDFSKAYPHELSGGMRQRAALARALVLRPEILLMDEPFAALDALLRQKMQRLLLEVYQTLEQTVLLVTHDVEEALAVAHRVVVLSPRPGRVIDTIVLPGNPVSRQGDHPALQTARIRIRAALTDG